MKKTLTINLNNTVFHIDDDAYELLQSYLAEVGVHFKSEAEKADIMNDIEARIAELFSEKMLKNKNVITVEDVGEIIEIMGKPSQFVEEEADEENPQPEPKKPAGSSKKFYRDTEHQLLGGVGAGLAAYFNMDITLVRVILIILLILTSGYLIPVYLLAWLIAPKAETTAQKLEMRGEDVNIETIKNKMNDAKTYLESNEFKESATSVGQRFFDIFKAFFKVIFAIIGSLLAIVGVFVAAALIFGLIVLLFEPDAITNIYPELFTGLGGVTPEKIILMVIGLLLVIGCPVFALISWGIKATSKEQPKSYTAIWVAVVLWLAGIFMFLSVGTDTVKKLKDSNLLSFNRNGTYVIEDNPDFISESRNVATFNAIEASGAVQIELSQQKEQTISVNSLKEYIPNIKTEVVDGVLKIYSIDNLIKPRIKIRVSMDSLTAISARGASNIDFATPFSVKRLNITLQGASKADMDFSSAQNLKFDMEGASKIELKGYADTLKIDAAGATKVEAEDLQTKVADIEMNGASKATVFATESFSGKAHGASKIVCKGNPKQKNNESNTASKIIYE